MNKILVFALVVVLSPLGCAWCKEKATFQSTLIAEEKLVNIEMIPTTWNDSSKFRLQTDQHVFIGWGTPPPARIGSVVGYRESNDGRYFIQFTSSESLYFVGNK
jgi:hypothetical protein